MEWESTLCDGCRHAKHETFHPDAEDAFTADGLRCHACAARDRAARELRDSPDADTAGMYFVIEKLADAVDE